MTVTLNLPPNVERAFLAEAQAKGLFLGSVETSNPPAGFNNFTLR